MIYGLIVALSCLCVILWEVGLSEYKGRRTDAKNHNLAIIDLKRHVGAKSVALSNRELDFKRLQKQYNEDAEAGRVYVKKLQQAISDHIAVIEKLQGEFDQLAGIGNARALEIEALLVEKYKRDAMLKRIVEALANLDSEITKDTSDDNAVLQPDTCCASSGGFVTRTQGAGIAAD